ncbi:MAG: bifunctional folylpolyglutamate synthase/dihydrofolate synthase [Thermoplasmata archaeon]
MFSNLQYMYDLKREGVKYDLSIMNSFADYMGHPENDFKSFHITGSNGKGSVSAFIFNIMRSYGSVGLYTSPHLVRFNERIILDKKQISDEYINSFIGNLKGTIEELAKNNRNPTFFEVTTMMAFKFFSEMKAEYGSIEVGLGGRLDATNIITPAVSVIAQVGYEHADKLGCSLSSIATEKAGIIKEGRPVVLQDDKPEVISAVKRIATLKHSKLIRLDRSEIRNLITDENGTSFDFKTENDEYHLKTKAIGDYQALNAATAVLAVENSGIDYNSKAIEKGISETIWPGRLEILSRNPMVVIDAAHNPPAANQMVRSFLRVFKQKPLLVVGMLSDKDSYSYLHILRKISDRIIFTTPDEKERAMDPDQLNRLYGHIFSESRAISDPLEALREAKEESDFVFVTGSIYLIGIIKGIYTTEVMPFSL